MHTVQFEIPKPTDESAFEDMCARIYGEVFEDALPKINGRSGQAQAGIDVFVNCKQGRVGIQCKRYVDGALTLKVVQKEIERADNANVPIVRLIVATTAASDAKVVRQVQELSDQRVRQGKFSVEVEFWEEICRHIRGSGKLQRDYAPNAPGGMFHRFDESNRAMHAALARLESKFETPAALPESRDDSVNKFISSELDAVNDLLKEFKYLDALQDLSRLGANMASFDVHQKARWYLQRGICNWHLGDTQGASSDFLKSSELYPNDEKMAAARVRGLLLREDVAEAVAAGKRAQDDFPSSTHVWIAYANARMVAGETLNISDIPITMRDDCHVLQLIAWARKQAGDRDGAIEISQKALELPDAGFFVRRTALALALEAATADPVISTFRLAPANHLDALERAVAHFIPRRERVWAVQSQETLVEVITHLGYAYIALGRPQEALQVVEEARHADMLVPSVLRVALEALKALGRYEEALQEGRTWLPHLEEDALVSLAEVAANSGDIDLVSAIIEQTRRTPTKDAEVSDALMAMRWIALWNSKDGREAAAEEVKSAGIAALTSIPMICAGARILHLVGEDEQRKAAVSRALELVKSANSGSNVLLLADLLFTVGEYQTAAEYYERFAVSGKKSELHTRLLACYVKSGARRKAHQLLESFPGDWALDDELRSLALELGHRAADWNFLVPLARIQCELAPRQAGAWLLRLVVDLKTRKMHSFHQILESLPDDLEGSHRQLMQLSSLELKYDRAQSGMRRLYRLYRRNMDDLEAASGYFIGIVAARGELPNMEEALPSVTDGVAVSLEGSDGERITICIDPADAAPLPAREGFYSFDNPDIRVLVGAKVGSTIELPGPYKRQFTVKSISSVHRRMLQLAQEQFRTSISGNGLVFSVPVPKTEKGADFSRMHAMLKQQAQHTKESLDLYQSAPLTLGILARLLGRNVTDIVFGWRPDGPPLFMCAGTHEERLEAASLLERENATYVLDAATISELVLLECQEALAALPKVYCSTRTLEMLQDRLEEAKAEQPGGRVYDDEGVMRFVEFGERDRVRHIAQCQAMVDAVAQYCEVLPAYGGEALPEGLSKAEEILAAEEYSALLLVADKAATLLTIDGRLAQLAMEFFQRKTVWPQVLLHRALENGVISRTQYSIAVIREFLCNRSFVSLTAYELLLLCQQGGATLRHGLQRFKQYLSSPSTEFGSAVNITFDFLELQAMKRTQVTALMELLEHLLEAMLRHPECRADVLLSRAQDFASDIAWKAARPLSTCPPAWDTRRRRYEFLEVALLRAIATARDHAASPARRRAIKLKTLMCMNPPYLAFDSAIQDVDDVAVRSEATDESATSEQESASGIVGQTVRAPS